jgi:hypothetical protein
MARRTKWSALLALVTLLALAAPAQAGGWAVVTLDGLPSDLRAGQSVSLGFMVRQHGDKPVDVHAWEDGMPVFTATSVDTGETLRIEARKEGELGHYVVDVAFPGAGTWDVEIKPGWFAATKLGTFTVLPAASATSTVSAWTMQAATLRVVGGALVLAALGLLFIHSRGKAAQRVPALRNR